MKQTKPSSLARILSYAGGHRKLTILGCILSALSAPAMLLSIVPCICTRLTLTAAFYIV